MLVIHTNNCIHHYEQTKHILWWGIHGNNIYIRNIGVRQHLLVLEKPPIRIRYQIHVYPAFWLCECLNMTAFTCTRKATNQNTVSNTCTETCQKYSVTVIFYYIFHIKPQFLKTLFQSQFLFDFDDFFTNRSENVRSFLWLFLNIFWEHRF
jgi:hypothetical protein